MSELQISLLGIGIAVVLAVYAYSGWQQCRYRRKFGATFKPGHEDALYRPAAPDMSIPEISTPEIPAIALFDTVLAGNRPLLPHATDSVCVLLDADTDYIAVISPKSSMRADALAQLWQQRFDFGKNIHVCGVNAASGLWEKVIAESPGAYSAFKLAVQLVSRSGAVSEARLADFRDLARMIAAQLQADVALPDVTQAAARAQELDKFCAAVDQMIGLNILPGGERLLSGGEVARVAGQHELSLQADGSFHLFDAQGHTLFSLGNCDSTPFQHHTLEQMRVSGLTLLLDVPRVEQPTQHFDQMAVLARQLATDLHAAMADDHHVALGETGIALIRGQVAAVEANMLAGHIIPGSAQARRLFS